jgi:hypothetical protein
MIDFDPDFMMATSFFLGMKSAQQDISIEKLIRIFKFIGEFNKKQNLSNTTILLKYEFYLISILNYDFYVFCPYKAMSGLCYKLKQNQIELNNNNKANKFYNINIQDIEKLAEAYIDKTFLTDVIFLFNYSYISLSSIYLSINFLNKEITLEEFFEILDLKNKIDIDKFNNIYNKIFELIEKIPKFTREEIKEKKSRRNGFLERYKEYSDRLEKDRQ